MSNIIGGLITSNINQSIVIKAKNILSAKMATCYFVIGGNRYLAMNLTTLESKLQLNKTDVPILGTYSTPKKITGVSGAGKATFYEMSSRFKKLVLDFLKGGPIPYFDIETANEDPQSEAGRQSIVLRNCLFDEISLANFDANGDFLKSDLAFSFEDAEMPEEFKTIEGAV